MNGRYDDEFLFQRAESRNGTRKRSERQSAAETVRRDIIGFGHIVSADLWHEIIASYAVRTVPLVDAGLLSITSHIQLSYIIVRKLVCRIFVWLLDEIPVVYVWRRRHLVLLTLSPPIPLRCLYSLLWVLSLLYISSADSEMWVKRVQRAMMHNNFSSSAGDTVVFKCWHLHTELSNINSFFSVWFFAQWHLTL